MAIEFVPGGVINILGALLVASLGAVVLWVAPRRAENRAFALFAMGLALGVVPSNFWLTDRPTANALLSALSEALWALAAVGAVWLGHVAGRRAGEPRWPTLVGVATAAAAAVPAITVTIARFHTLDDAFYASVNAVPPSTGALVTNIFFFYGAGAAIFAAVGTLTLRAWRLGPDDAVTLRRLALLTGAIALLTGFVSGATALSRDVRVWSYAAGTLPLCGVWAATWIARTHGSADPRVCRNAAILILVGPLLGLVFGATGLGNQGGTVRVLSVTVLAYGILRHQLLGLDVKVRWTISKTTMAAVFVAAFFVVSEGAAAVFESTTGSTTAGILAAGTLVFAIAPLSRFADRLAERAVPLSGPATRAEEAYRAVLCRYVVGGISRDEERALALLATELRIDAARAFDLREAIEREHDTSKPP